MQFAARPATSRQTDIRGALSACQCPARSLSHAQMANPAAKRRRTVCFAEVATSDTVTAESKLPGTNQEAGYDVYVNDAQFLDKGEEKHIISVFVADESGMINRVAGVFARRGANIDSLAVGLNLDKALFTIVVTGTKHTVENLVKQLTKLVKVRYVEDITSADRVERELVLVKLKAPPGPARSEVMQLAQVFRARCVDVSDQSLTVCCSGDAGKTYAMQQILAKFGILQVARTGKISLKRGEELLEMGGWGDGRQRQRQSRREDQNHASDSPKPAENGARGESHQEGSDVYAVDTQQTGVWEVENVLDAKYDANASEFSPRIVSIEVRDVPGVLNQVTGVLARRGYNIQSLAVGPSEKEGLSRIVTIIPQSKDEDTSKITKQLLKLINVHQVKDLSDVPYTSRELMLVKVKCSAAQRGELRDLAQIFHGNICDVSLHTMTLELQGKEDKMQAIQKLLQPYGILEIARTGQVALSRESGLNSKYLDRLKSFKRESLAA